MDVEYGRSRVKETLERFSPVYGNYVYGDSHMLGVSPGLTL